MSLKFKLRKNNIKSNKSYGKWYAHTLRGSEVTLDEIEQQIQDCCSVTRADVRAVVTALQEVVARDLKDGHVVSLGELGKFYLSIRSESVDNPASSTMATPRPMFCLVIWLQRRAPSEFICIETEG